MLSTVLRAGLIALLAADLQAHVHADSELKGTKKLEDHIWLFANASHLLFSALAALAAIAPSRDLRLFKDALFTSVVLPYSAALMYLTVAGHAAAAHSFTSFIAPIVTVTEVLLSPHAPPRPNLPLLLSVAAGSGAAYMHKKDQYFNFIVSVLVGCIAWALLRVVEDLLWHNLSLPSPSSSPLPSPVSSPLPPISTDPLPASKPTTPVFPISSSSPLLPAPSRLTSFASTSSSSSSPSSSSHPPPPLFTSTTTTTTTAAHLSPISSLPQHSSPLPSSLPLSSTPLPAVSLPPAPLLSNESTVSSALSSSPSLRSAPSDTTTTTTTTIEGGGAVHASPAKEVQAAPARTPRSRPRASGYDMELKRLAPFGTPGPNSPGFGEISGRTRRRTKAE